MDLGDAKDAILPSGPDLHLVASAFGDVFAFFWLDALLVFFLLQVDSEGLTPLYSSRKSL